LPAVVAGAVEEEGDAGVRLTPFVQEQGLAGDVDGRRSFGHRMAGS
jgi:hypothetical protein